MCKNIDNFRISQTIWSLFGKTLLIFFSNWNAAGIRKIIFWKLLKNIIKRASKIILKIFAIFLNTNVPQYFLQDVFLLKNHLTVEYNSHKIIKKSLMWSVQDTCICTLDRPLITRSRSRIWQSTFDSKASSKISSSVRCLKMLNIQNDDFLRASVRHNVSFWPLLYSLNYVLGYFSCSSKQP